MNEKYTPVKPEDVFSETFSETIADYFNGITEQKKPKIQTIDFLLNSLAVEKEEITNYEMFIRNYLFATITARKHLCEIEERIKEIKKRINCFNNRESYPCRKLKHFQKKNEKARNEIVYFLCYGLDKFLSEHNRPYSDLINRDDADKMWLLGPTYDYNYNSQYYNPDYDFSTYVKFFNTPKASILDSFKNIDSTITLKNEDIEKYYKKVIETVDNNNLLKNMAERIAMNYHFHKRKEIFETMATLFNEEKYTTFVLTATIQIEGMFYELVTIRYGKKENQGALSEKVDKTFRKNSQQKHALYPYFAFDIPELRNKVAHIGIVDDENIKNIAYEIVLDLHCILSIAEDESLNKFKNILWIYKKITEIDSDGKEKNDYIIEVAEKVFIELYMGNHLSDDYFWMLLINPSDYEEELNYYLPKEKDEDHIYLKTMVQRIHNILQHELFWQVVLDYCKKLTEIDYSQINDLGAFIEKLKNMFIPRLNGKTKELCCEVNKKLQSIKKEKDTNVLMENKI